MLSPERNLNRVRFRQRERKKNKATFLCVRCRQGVAKGEYIDSQAEIGRLDTMPLALVAEGAVGRVYLPLEGEQLKPLARAKALISEPSIAAKIPSEPAKETLRQQCPRPDLWIKTFADYFTPRQLVALTTFSDLVGEARERVRKDVRAAQMPNDGKGHRRRRPGRHRLRRRRCYLSRFLS